MFSNNSRIFLATKAASINGIVRDVGMLVWTDGPNMGERIPLFCAHSIWVSHPVLLESRI
jgi:hypothetical protein